ncbi:hypothetical protein NC652_002133 [Populus alba x Populus x berolinensis]|uniref:Uncharacterized protein n=1 Tax=Populus alba x Populus x berolinensis TaxID=444605 RepID=A0AAD6RN75_9ROSI|nr:hypothetical protein NC652_002133 [Populus alba x Populus x berolinensis]KAJ7012018.1 hypothetical protein NC653_002189 [Populus alba x Populus x berolinensis]
MTYEINMEKHELEEKPKKNLEFITIHLIDSDDDHEEGDEDIVKNHHHKRVMKATWSDDSNSNPSDDEKHVAIMCFMTIKSDIRYFFR